MAAADIFDKIPHLWAAEGRGRLGRRLPLNRLQLRLRRLLGVELLPGPGGENILVKSIEQILRQLIGRNAHHLCKLLPLAATHLAVKSNQPVGKGCQGVLVLGA